MRQRFLDLSFFLCLFLFYGCVDATETNTQSNKSNVYNITLQAGRLTINGQHLPMPMPVHEVTQKIGDYSRFAAKGNDIYTWDAHGFKLWSRPNKQTIFEIGIYIKKKKPVAKDRTLASGQLFIDSRPKQDFSGTFILDGVNITQRLTFETLNAKKSGSKFNRTHWADQFKYYSKIADTGQSYRVIVYLNENRTINYIEIVYDNNLDEVLKK